jgi:hypothetical protein
MGTVIVILIILIIIFYLAKRKEHMTDIRSNIMLYEGFDQKNLAYSESLKPGEYIKKMVRINLKSVDINLPKLGDKYDEIRRVEIWAMNNEDVNASLESGFYNSYLEPEIEFRANPAKYRKILRVLPGEHLVMNMTVPIKKIMLMISA